MILLVEDNVDDAALAVRAFRKHAPDREIHVADDGVEALAMLHGTDGRRVEPLPRVVLLDLKLPRLDGFQVLARIREEAATRTLPVVILSSSREDSDLRRCYELGANGYLQKPVSYADFVAEAKVIDQFWVGMNQLPPGR